MEKDKKAILDEILNQFSSTKILFYEINKITYHNYAKILKVEDGLKNSKTKLDANLVKTLRMLICSAKLDLEELVDKIKEYERKNKTYEQNE